MQRIFFTLLTILCSTAYGQWSSNPSVNNPVCNFAGNQTMVQSTTDGAGGAISTWVDTRNGTQDIYAQRIDANGNLLWAVDGIAICNAVSDQFSPRLASDGNGGAIITWYDNRSGNYDIYAQNVNAGGIAQWTVDGVAICMASGNQNAQQLIADGSGGAIIAWSDGRPGGPNADIYAQRINSFGSVLWAVDGTAVCTAASLQNIPQLVSDGSGGAIVAWEDWRSFSQPDIYAQRISSSGFANWSFNGVVICSEPNLANQYNSRIISDGSGGAIICWLDNRSFSSNTDIYAQKVNAAGTTQWLSNGIAICNANAIQLAQQMVSDGAGGAIISWEDRRTERNIYAQRINTTGIIQWLANGIAVCNEPGIQEEPQLAVRTSGGAILLWTDSRNGSQQDIYAQGIDAAGTALWPAGGVPVANESNSQSAAQLISDGAGGAIIAWQDLRSMLDYDIYSSRLYANGTLPVRLLFLTAARNQRNVLITWDTDNEVNSSHFDIEYSLNGISFTKLARADAKNLPGINHYSFVHISFASTAAYYRLKQVDLDGRFVHSKIIKVELVKEMHVMVSPNPAGSFIQLKDVKADEIRAIQIVSVDGRSWNTNTINNQMQINISHLSGGVYIIKLVKKDNSVTTSQFVKQ
ncbi:MAG: T9SS type A sorting domain-containing protein [Chitinophagaceae bacterium]